MGIGSNLPGSGMSVPVRETTGRQAIISTGCGWKSWEPVGTGSVVCVGVDILDTTGIPVSVELFSAVGFSIFTEFEGA